MRDAIQTANVKTLQGPISFDQNGDVKDRVRSIFRYQHDTGHPDNDIIHHEHYIGAAPQVS